MKKLWNDYKQYEGLTMTKPCGCEPGHPCLMALTLLDEVMELREKFAETGDADDWEAYLAVKREYDAHRWDDSCGESRERS